MECKNKEQSVKIDINEIKSIKDNLINNKNTENSENTNNERNVKNEDISIKSIINKCFNIDDNTKNKKIDGNIDIKLFVLLLKIIFKKQKHNDIFVQFLETKIIRSNAYMIHNLNDLIEIITNNNNTKENKWDCFCVLSKEIIKIINDYNEKIDQNVFIDHEELRHNIILAIENNIADIKNKENEIQLTFDNIPQDKTIKLSPTSGIQQLNNNPYSFFVSKILDLKQLDKWQMKVDSTIYGILVHNIAQDFTNCCKQIDFSIFKKEKKIFSIDTIYNFHFFLKNAISTSIIFNKYWKIVEYNCKKYSVKNNTFLLIKFINIFICLFNIEYEAKNDNRDVLAEKSYSINIEGITIIAKADRIEINRNKKLIYIYDYKTGNVKTKKDEEKKGEKPQLSIIASILKQTKEFQNYQIVKMRYISLSGIDNDNNFEDIELEYIEYSRKNLNELVNTFFKNGKPKIEKMVFILQNINIVKMHNDEQILHLARETRIA